MVQIYNGKMWLLQLGVLIFMSLLGSNCAQTLSDEYRLPTDVIPLKYSLSLKPYLIENNTQLFTFDGSVTITVRIEESTNIIKMHSQYLEYKTREYWRSGDQTTNVLNNFSINETTNIITYVLPSTLVKGEEYFLKFSYTGKLDTDMRGFYRSSYKNSTGGISWIAASHMEPKSARRAFPGWDEPHFKATFSVKIIRPKFLRAFTNTLLQKTENIDNTYEEDTFEETPVMAMYLNAFLVGDLTQRTNGNYSVIARADYYDQTQYSFEFGQQVLSVLENYFDIKYYTMGIPKLDSVAVPDFRAGAMENWGLIKYKESNLCFDYKESSLNYKHAIATVIAHEQTHLWFGDLVTCDWWSYTWLNEGFAQFFEYFAAAEVEPTLELDKTFVVEIPQVVLELDSTGETTKLNSIDEDTPTLLNHAFNTITYYKGASFIRMVKSVLGEENFQHSLRKHLDNKRYQTVQPNDIFEMWSEHFPTKFKGFATDFFNSFSWQVGYPLVTVQVSQDRKSFQVTQKRFLMDPSDGSDSSLLYTTPFTYTTNLEKNFNETSTDFFLPPSTTSTYIPLNQSIDWIIGNIQEVGFYRVNYDEETWKHIRQALTSPGWGSIHEINRAQIVDDLFNLARADEIPYSLALNILEYLENETNYLAWEAAFRGFSFLSKKLGDNLTNFSQHILKLTNNVYTSLGFVEKKDDKPLDILLRSLLIEWTCKHGSESCINTAKSYFQNMNNTPVPPNIRLPVYCVAIREGSQTEFELLNQKYFTTTVATEKSLILSALGCLKDENLIKRYIDFISTDDVRLQDKSSALSSLTQYNNENVTPVFRIVTENHVKLAAALGGYSSLASVIENIADRFTTESQLEELRSFIYQNQENIGNLLAGTEKKVIINLKWSSERLGPVHEYLNQGVGVASTTVPLPLVALIAIFVVNKVL